MDEGIKSTTTQGEAVDPATLGLDRFHELTDEYIATVGLLEEVQRIQKMARKWDHNCALYWLQQKESAFIKHLRSVNHKIGDAWDNADKVKPNK